ncbi:uncharacterized protein EDB91DRAFT_1255424 [Suillus paluster]|uniref:uncharacterized protein n=1 Tax=Suillus paluster TaxID=48578 RepID=UPI001B86E860|nr:uncharacterized protein EDB91DRAFT_1255424 [Suillus paluster]KAG1724052.1 hypothetical protein EDB91DRAFT_1255424 [Suillus paluster]
MSKYCEFPDCEGGPYTNEEAQKHKWRYHSFPVSSIIGGHEYIVAQSDTYYACPLPGCDKELRKRNDMQKHIIPDQNGSVSIKVFDTSMDQDRDVSVQALVPGTPSPQGIIPTVDNGSPVDSDMVKLLPLVDYLKSNKALDALGEPDLSSKKYSCLDWTLPWSFPLTQNENAPRLSAAWPGTYDHFRKAVTILDGHPQKLSLSKILVHSKNIPQETDTYWKLVAESNKNYPNHIIQFVRCMIHLHLDCPLKFSFSLSEEQTPLLEELIMLLQDPHVLRHSRMISYHNLAWSLVNADPTQCNVSWANPIQRAIWLKALRVEGNFYEATDLTPDLAK